jgi:hypothetical protein
MTYGLRKTAYIGCKYAMCYVLCAVCYVGAATAVLLSSNLSVAERRPPSQGRMFLILFYFLLSTFYSLHFPVLVCTYTGTAVWPHGLHGPGIRQRFSKVQGDIRILVLFPCSHDIRITYSSYYFSYCIPSPDPCPVSHMSRMHVLCPISHLHHHHI